MALAELKHFSDVIVAFLKNPSKAATLALAIGLWILPLFVTVPGDLNIYRVLVAVVLSLFIVFSLVSHLWKIAVSAYKNAQRPSIIEARFRSELTLLDDRLHEILAVLIAQNLRTPKIECLDVSTMGRCLNILQSKGFIESFTQTGPRYVTGPQIWTSRCTIDENAYHFLVLNAGSLRRISASQRFHGYVC